MYISSTSEYALRSMVFLVQQEPGIFVSADVIAEQTELPRRYLSKVLTDLVRARLLVAARGKKGGFRIAGEAAEISLYDVLRVHEQFERSSCWFGNQMCSDTNPCSAHRRWKQFIEQQEEFLKTTLLADVISTE